MKKVPHPPSSPYLVPSNFYQFGKVKTALMAAEFETERDLFDGPIGVPSAIPRDELKAVFDEWLIRLDVPIQRKGDPAE
jgi:hypothetical protein